MTTLERVQRNARSYPGFLLPICGTALSLFAAGYHGWNDCVHFLRRDMQCTCVDLDEEKLREMKRMYPSTWSFSVADAWSFAEREAEEGRMYDVVSVDTYLGDATDRSMRSLELWTSLSLQLVTATMVIGDEPEIPDGWVAVEFPRSPRASWLVLTPEAA